MKPRIHKTPRLETCVRLPPPTETYLCRVSQKWTCDPCIHCEHAAKKASARPPVEN